MTIDLTKYPDFEQRKPRATYTATLQKICARLDANPKQTLKYESMFVGTPVRAEIRAVGLWVVGSYARGALTCGDLDLVLELEGVQMCPRPTLLTKSFVGAMRGVRTHLGNPERNDANVKFTEAVQVWAPGLNWKAAIAAILPNAAAGRFPRPSDAIPVRTEQTGLPIELLEPLWELREAGAMRWTFTPLSTVPPVLDLAEGNERKVMDRLSGESAVKTKLVPYVAEFCRQLRVQRHIGVPALGPNESYSLRVGGACVNIDQLWLCADYFDDLDTTCVAFIPAPSTRGPNGFWTIERDSNHWLEKSFSTAHAFVHVRADGSCAWERQATHYSLVLGELFTQEHLATAALETHGPLESQVAGTTGELAVRRVQGRELLEVLAQFDVVRVDGGQEHPITMHGAMTSGKHDPVPANQLCAVFGGTAVPQPKP